MAYWAGVTAVSGFSAAINAFWGLLALQLVCLVIAAAHRPEERPEAARARLVS